MNLLERARAKYYSKYSLRQRWEVPEEVEVDRVKKVVSYFVIGLLVIVLKHLFTFLESRMQEMRGFV
jgi:hypothetical protein